MLIWNSLTQHNRTLHTALVAEISEATVRKSIEACAEHAISTLNENIQDDSLYLLCEWQPATAELSISVTDARKTHDAPNSYRCVFTELARTLVDEKTQQTYTESVKFWLHDYLSSYAPFFNYSLVAIFHSSTREQTELL